VRTTQLVSPFELKAGGFNHGLFRKVSVAMKWNLFTQFPWNYPLDLLDSYFFP